MRATDNVIVANTAGVNVTESYAVFTHNLVADNAPQGGFAYNNFLEHMRPAVLRENIFWGNRPGQVKIGQTAAGVPVVADNHIEGGWGGADNATANPRIIDDSFGVRVTRKSQGPMAGTTLFDITGEAAGRGARLAGRVAQVGKQFSVIRGGSVGHLELWGDVTDASEDLRVLGTYRLAPDSPARGHGPRRSLP